ncbi:hypothetical protein C2845_PM03G02750 [Panicum miliaceum]|uniref:Uncharacterized protein n=1 Tax=Panicum miliaceum TaxID=4540 RepID=A0A3L6T6E4_PANMI|nr:hypothetical protein C2845_PM03G02750 [Panicum miliaceum]
MPGSSPLQFYQLLHALEFTESYIYSLNRNVFPQCMFSYVHDIAKIVRSMAQNQIKSEHC